MSDAKYEIAFYQTRDGECQVWDFLDLIAFMLSLY